MTLVFCLFQAYSERSGSQLRVIFSFYVSTIVSALDAVDRVSDAIISKLLPYVQRVTPHSTSSNHNALRNEGEEAGPSVGAEQSRQRDQ